MQSFWRTDRHPFSQAAISSPDILEFSPGFNTQNKDKSDKIEAQWTKSHINSRLVSLNYKCLGFLRLKGASQSSLYFSWSPQRAWRSFARTPTTSSELLCRIQARDQVLQRAYRQASFEQLIHVNNFTLAYLSVGVWWQGDFAWWRQQEIKVPLYCFNPLFIYTRPT